MLAQVGGVGVQMDSLLVGTYPALNGVLRPYMYAQGECLDEPWCKNSWYLRDFFDWVILHKQYTLASHRLYHAQPTHDAHMHTHEALPAAVVAHVLLGTGGKVGSVWVRPGTGSIRHE